MMPMPFGAAGARGCIGLWKEALLPGAYYLNRHAYDITPVDTRAQTWEYKGGYKRRTIDLSLDQQGQLTQTERSFDEPVPSTAVDRAVMMKVEGWDIPQELRVVAQVAPENAPIVAGRSAASRRSSTAFDAAHPLHRAQCRGLEYQIAEARRRPDRRL